MTKTVSLAMETTCRQGGLALGIGGELRCAVDFDATSRHAARVVQQGADLLAGGGLTARDLDEVYVSAGPGSFTGIRVGVTVARTLAQAVDGLRCVRVPTTHAIAANAADLDWQHLGVVLDAREDRVHVTVFARGRSGIEPRGAGRIVLEKDFADSVPKPILLIGEGLGYHDLAGEGVACGSPDQADLHRPRPENVWRVGRAMAERGEFTPQVELLPIYARQPEAVRLWERRKAE